jgi:hypothetical protein
VPSTRAYNGIGHLLVARGVLTVTWACFHNATETAEGLFRQHGDVALLGVAVSSNIAAKITLKHLGGWKEVKGDYKQVPATLGAFSGSTAREDA